MFCNKCGKEIPDGVKFCDNCGAAVPQSGSRHARPEPEEELSSFSDKEQYKTREREYDGLDDDTKIFHHGDNLDETRVYDFERFEDPNAPYDGDYRDPYSDPYRDPNPTYGDAFDQFEDPNAPYGAYPDDGYSDDPYDDYPDDRYRDGMNRKKKSICSVPIFSSANFLEFL